MFVTSLIIFITIMSCLIVLVVKANMKTTSVTNSHVVQEPEIIYHKTIPVEVIDIRNTWFNVKTNTYIYNITIESKEYNLKKSLDITQGNPYFYEAYTGNIKQGDTILANLISFKQGDKITRRYIDQLIK